MKTFRIVILFVIGHSVLLSTNIYAQEIRQYQNDIRRVSKEEFKAFLDAHDHVQLVDVRTPEEFQEGTVQDAINIDYYNADFRDQIAKLDKTVPTLIFCRSGGRSAKALQLFKSEGFNIVLELDGGYLNWSAE